jgi:hypothetical protein
MYFGQVWGNITAIQYPSTSLILSISGRIFSVDQQKQVYWVKKTESRVVALTIKD